MVDARHSEARSKMLRRSAGEIKRYRRAIQFIKATVSLLIVAVTITYIASALYSRTGNFTVGINKFEDYGLSLCEEQNFLHPQTQLVAKAHDNVTNMSVLDLPTDLDSPATGGSHNGSNHLAYTFFLKNSGEFTVTYEFYVYITNVTNQVDRAVRIRVYRNGVYTDYARSASDGSGAEPGTTAFMSDSIVCREQLSDFAPGQITRYTVVIWVEGDDPDCLDHLIGGQIKVGATMSVVTPDGE